MNKIKSILAANIKAYRKKLHLTQEQAAEKAGISVNYWQRLELPAQIELPSFLAFSRIAQTLRIKPYKLLKE
jgi:transcriptional regulator with XRE-family HTH domain